MLRFQRTLQRGKLILPTVEGQKDEETEMEREREDLSYERNSRAMSGPFMFYTFL